MSNNKFTEYLSELYHFRFVLQQIIRQQLILRYRRTVFGYLWTLFNPLLMMSVTAIVFSTIFKMDLKSYAVFLFAGMIPFSFFSTSVTQSGQSLIGNEALIKKIYIPKLIFPLGICIALLIDSVLSAVALFAIILAIGGNLTMTLFFIPVSYVLLFLFSFGIALVMTISTTYFRDLQHVVGILMQALLFLTPVFYKPEFLQGKVAWFIALNPLTPFVELFRMPIYLGVFPDALIVLSSIFLSFLSLVIGLWFFCRYEKSIIFRL
jgi:ABC-type polysaccharide/polyol phosphate export permease